MNRILITVSFALLSTSCAKERAGGPGGEEVRFGIMAQLHTFVPSEEQTDGGSRAIVEGTTFISGGEVGYIILGSTGSDRNEHVPHLGGYGNVRALAITNKTETQAGAWAYYIYRTQYLGQKLSGFPSYGNVDIYGYHPYDPDVDAGDLTAIPFRLGAVSGTEVITTGEMVEKDYMYATPVSDYQMQAGQSAQMVFNHVMTCLEFRIRKMFAGPALTISTIDFTITGGNGRVFCVSGTYNAVDGTVYENESATRILVNYNKTLGNSSTSEPTTSYMSCALILPELKYTGADDATITAVFHFTDQDGNEWIFRDGANTTYSFNLSEVVDPVSGHGLHAGKRYQVTVDVSNFVKYSGLPKVNYPAWETEDAKPNII